MPGDTRSCPCGAHVTDPTSLVTYVTDAVIDAVFAGVLSKVKYLGVLAPFTGSVLDVATICASPKPEQPTWNLTDFANPSIAGIKAAQLLRAKVYELNCTCDDCPPVTGCGAGGTVLTVGPDDGFLPDPNQPAVREYLIPPTEIWAERVADGDCLGFYGGVDIVWHVGGLFDPDNGVSITPYGGGPGRSWSQNILSGDIRLYIGGTPMPPEEPIPEAPAGVADWYGPPACTNSDICAALAVTEERVRRIEFLTTVLAGPLYGLTTPIDVELPGIPTPITGTLVEVLGRLVTALAPVTPMQLINPAVVTVTEPSLIDVTGQAYVRITPTVVPPSLGFRGSGDTEIYYSNHRTPGPGWVCVYGVNGVLFHREILYPTGLEIPLPGTATDLAIEVSPLCEMEVTTWQRDV